MLQAKFVRLLKYYPCLTMFSPETNRVHLVTFVHFCDKIFTVY